MNMKIVQSNFMNLFKEIRNVLFFTFVICSLLHCKVDQAGIEGNIIVNPSSELDEYWWDDKVTNNIEYFVMKGKNDFPLGRTRKIIKIGNTIISSSNRAGIYFHNLEGEFLYHLSPSGKGPLEFSEVNDIAIFDENHILINDVIKKSVLKYDFKNHAMKEEYNTGTSVFNIWYANDILMYTISSASDGVLKYVKNFDFSTQNTVLYGTSFSNVIISPYPFLNLDNERVFINVGFLDTMVIFNTKSLLIEKKYVLGQGQTNIMSLEKDKILSAINQHELKRFENIIVPIGSLGKFGKYVTIPLFGYKNQLTLILNLDNDESHFYSFKHNTSSKVNFIECMDFPVVINSINDDYIYTILNVLSRNKREEKPDWPFVKKYNQLVEDKVENPVIARFKMK